MRTIDHIRAVNRYGLGACGRGLGRGCSIAPNADVIATDLDGQNMLEHADEAPILARTDWQLWLVTL